MQRHNASRVRFLLAALFTAGVLLAQRSDRAIITGVVTDPNGFHAAGCTVTIRNEATAVETKLVTNDAGDYTSPPLVLGTYTVTVEQSGFKTFVRAGILLGGGEVVRVDAALELGAVSEKVEVSASAEMINVSQPDVTHTVDERYYRDLPIVMGADIRLAESLLQIQPGFLPMKPNGDPMFRGSQFNSRINGGQTMATENFFDGAAFGYAVGHQQSHESAPPVESIQEMKVINTSYSAQYGHTSGGFIEYTSKSGTNELHGSLYEYFANDALNARGFFPDSVTKQRNNAFGFTAGAPVIIPKVYSGKNKLFFFTNFDWLKFRSGVLPGFGNTTPIDAFKAGDFSSLLTSNQIATDALGRAVYQGQIFNPATTRLINNIPVRDPYPGNIIPTNDPLRSAVASQISSLLVHPDRPGTAFNVAGNPSGDQTWILNARTILFRVDYNIKSNFRSSTSFYWNHRPSIRNCGEVAGCFTEFNGETAPEKNDTYYGNGFYQRIATHHLHQQFDWIITNTLLNHTTVAYDRWFMGGNPLSAGVGWPEKLWGSNRGGIVDQTGGPPLIDWNGNIPYNPVGEYGWGNFGFLTNNRWQFSDDLSWVKGKHTIKIGFEYRHHQFPFAGWAVGDQAGHFNFNRLETGGYDASGNNLSQTGESFASFLLGQVHQSDQTIPVYPIFSEAYLSPWVNDEFKVTNRLTLTLGLRWDYQFARTERHDRYSTFDPHTPNPGAGGIPGALLFAGTGTGRTGHRTFEDPSKDAWGPRLGFAYRIGDKNVVRGGYGMYYSGVAFDEFIGQPTIGFQANPTAPNLTNGQYPAFYLDNGFPQNLITYPPFIDPSFANGTAPLAVAKNGETLPRFQNWSLTVERQVTSNMVLDLSYIGNRGTRLTHNWQTLGPAANMNDPKILALGSSLLNDDINSPDAKAAGINPPYPGFTGNVAQALRPYPQYQNINWRNVPTGKSIYHAFQATLEQRFAYGLQFRVSYTFSKLLNDGAESAQGGNGINAGIQNPIDTQSGEYGFSADDVPHQGLVAFTYALPFAKNSSSPWLRFLVGGWNLNGALRYESGRPLNIFMNNDLGGFLYNGQKRPNRLLNAKTNVDLSNFDPNAQRFFLPSAWADPGPLQFGNAPRRDGAARGFPTYNEDVSVFKLFPIKERARVRFEAQFGNVLNRVDFCDPDTNFSAGSFGQVSTQCNQPRSIQLGLRLDF
jgi:Carboxypeptidase regulatory-like domain/TonB dependent receptor-like, beta-barrel